MPTSAVDTWSGAGNPLALVTLRDGDAVLDVGCGGGLHALLAARQVGPGGHVAGVDLTSEMVRTARANAKRARATNVKFRDGSQRNCPFPTNPSTSSSPITSSTICASTNLPPLRRYFAFFVLRDRSRSQMW